MRNGDTGSTMEQTGDAKVHLKVWLLRQPRNYDLQLAEKVLHSNRSSLHSFFVHPLGLLGYSSNGDLASRPKIRAHNKHESAPSYQSWYIRRLTWVDACAVEIDEWPWFSFHRWLHYWELYRRGLHLSWIWRKFGKRDIFILFACQLHWEILGYLAAWYRRNVGRVPVSKLSNVDPRPGLKRPDIQSFLLHSQLLPKYEQHQNDIGQWHHHLRSELSGHSKSSIVLYDRSQSCQCIFRRENLHWRAVTQLHLDDYED